MASKGDEKLEIKVDDVVRWGERREIGLIKEIRIIDTAKFIQKFSGDEEEVMVRIHTSLGAALIWPKEHDILKVSSHEAKEFKLNFKQSKEGK
jgi:hypothetical protein